MFGNPIWKLSFIFAVPFCATRGTEMTVSPLSTDGFLSVLLVSQEGQRLMQEKPELSALVKKKLEEIRECWQDLESTTQAKARQLFEANRADLLVQSYSNLDQRLVQLEGQLAHVDYGQDLTTVNKQLKKTTGLYSSFTDTRISSFQFRNALCIKMTFPPDLAFIFDLSDCWFPTCL